MSLYIDGKPERQWAMEQVTRIFGFKTLAEIKSALKFDEDGTAVISKNGMTIVGTTNQKCWAPLRITWPGVGVTAEAALEYSKWYSASGRLA